jgi:hypothetical protein
VKLMRQNNTYKTVYHFTASHLLPGIKKNGLTKGKTPVMQGNGVLGFLDHQQWLTTDGNPINISVLDAGTFFYSRRAVKIKIVIPASFVKNLVSFDKVVEDINNMENCSALPGFDDFKEETSSWYIYKGDIPRIWIREIRHTGISK